MMTYFLSEELDVFRILLKRVFEVQDPHYGLEIRTAITKHTFGGVDRNYHPELTFFAIVREKFVAVGEVFLDSSYGDVLVAVIDVWSET